MVLHRPTIRCLRRAVITAGRGVQTITVLRRKVIRGGGIRRRAGPTTRRLVAPPEAGSLYYRREISRKPIKRPNCRPSSTARSSPTLPPTPLAPSSSTRRTRFSIWCSATVQRCATASASAGKASPGRALSALEQVAGLASAERDDRAPAVPAAFYGRRRRQPARGARPLSRKHGLSYPRHQSTVDHRSFRVVWLHPPHQRRRGRPLPTA